MKVQQFLLNKGESKNTVLFLMLAAVTVVVMGNAFAGTADGGFKDMFDFVSNMAGGYVGKTIALVALIGGAIGTGISGKATLLVTGLIVAVALFFGPTVINAVLTATV